MGNHHTRDLGDSVTNQPTATIITWWVERRDTCFDWEYYTPDGDIRVCWANRTQNWRLIERDTAGTIYPPLAWEFA